MKNIFLTCKLLSILILSLSLTSCGKKKKVDETLDNSVFFDITYTTQASRVEGLTTYTRVEGTQEMLFFSQSINVPNIDCSGKDDSGCFRIAYQNYKEPQLSSGVCSGGYEGTFTLRQTEVTTADTTDANLPYNPLNPYQPPSNGTTNEDTEIPEEERIYSYTFDLTVLRRSMSAGCTAVSPLDSFSLRIIRYPNGDLFVAQPTRSMEFYVIPKLRN